MASSIPALRTKLASRLKLSGGLAEPSTFQLDDFLVSAAKRAFAELPPIYQEDALVSGALTADVPELLFVLGVQSERDILFEHEWSRRPGGIRLRNYTVAKPGESVQIWHTKSVVVDLTLPFETSCVLGADWLEDYILELANKTTLGHLINIAGSNAGDLHGQQYRVSQDETLAIHTRLERERSRWDLMMREAKGERMYSVPPRRRSPLAGFKNRSRLVNRVAE